MLKIGIIGLGAIARKAYLPLITGKKVEIHLCTRDKEKLLEVGEQYRIGNLHADIDALIDSNIKGAFVHSATASHFEIVKQLLENNIHVFVDKPITYDYASAEKLILKAQQSKLALMVGFNRRYAPASQELQKLPGSNMILYQKNRSGMPGEVRTFIFDDFIHVVDTLLFLFPQPILKMSVSGRKKEGKLYHVTVQFTAADGTTAIGIMNRDSGTVEEKLEVFTSAEKRTVYNVVDSFVHHDKGITHVRSDDWESTLHKRGFDQLIDRFLQCVQSGIIPEADVRDNLSTHSICEQIVEKLLED